VAGIAAAVRLAGQGIKVTLVETRQRLGGRATSFVDPTTGRLLDNCQHVLLGCCTNLVDLYQRLGVADRIEWHRKLYFATPVGPGLPGQLDPSSPALPTSPQRLAEEGCPCPAERIVVDTLEGDDLPAPLHMARALLAFRGLTLTEKLAIARAMLAIIRLGPIGRAALHGTTFAHWLAAQRQSGGVIEKFWAPIVVGAVNEWPQRMAADMALQVFQEGMLAHEDAYAMGLSHVPLVQLYDAAERVIAGAGGQVLLSTSAQGFVYDARAQRIAALEIAGNAPLAAEAFVSSVPFDRLAKLCTPSMVTDDRRLGGLDQLEVSPIIGIHLWFAGPSAGDMVMDLPHLVLTGSPIHWIFNKSVDVEVGGQHLHAVVSAAHDLVDVPADDIIALGVREVRRFLPKAGGARLLHARVIKEKRATFSACPGVARLRPRARRGAAGGIGNLYLAGDWCATGWPATMEGATRSGYLAAGALLEDLGRPLDQVLAPDLPASPLYRFLGM
jgi:zeta-carotene desaturase